MNKKAGTRILIVVVAALWAYNIYRTIQNVQVKNEVQENTINAPLTFAPVVFDKDTFELDLPNKDPFLKNGSFAVQPIQPTTENPSPKPVKKENAPAVTINPQKKWPEITYFGYLKNHQSNHQLCLINLAGKNYRLAVGATKDAVTILQAYPDSIVVAFQNETKTVFK
ncbi:MAG: hypothetical protein IT222_08095 [Crocinitomix sp.]|nr:hypothetical protein [Crocinitomix sp.]